MDFGAAHSKQGLNAFSRFQGAGTDAEEELQGLTALGRLSSTAAAETQHRASVGSGSPHCLKQQQGPHGAAACQPLDLGNCDFSDATEFSADTPRAGHPAEGVGNSGGAASGSSGSYSYSNWVIHPEGQFKTGWIYIQLAVAMYIVWVTPVRVGFNIPSEGMWFWFEGMIDLFFYIDLVLNFFTAYEDKTTGDLVVSHKAIAQRYLTGWFAVDLLATFPVDYIVRAVEGSWMCSLRGDCSWAILHGGGISPIALLRLLRFFRIMWILKHVKFMRISTLLGGLADDLYAILPVLSILELVIILIYLGHISGCFFYLLSTPAWQTKVEKGLIASGEMTTWIPRTFGGHRIIQPPTAFNMTAFLKPSALLTNTNSSLMTPQLVLARPLPPTVTEGPKGHWWVCPDFGYDMVACPTCEGPPMRCKSHYPLIFRYITSMYWAYTTMTTVGYGDISSTTLAEKIWAIITMIVSGFFFSFVVGRMASIVAKLDSHRTAYNERMEVVTTFLKDTNLPRSLSKRVLDMFKKQATKPYDRQAVLGVLPFELKAKILRHLYAGAIRDVPLLRNIADDDLFMTDMCIRLQPYTCSANMFVYQRGEPGGDVFILMRGELLQLDVDLQTTIARIPEGSVFGETVVLRNLEGFDDAKRVTNMWCKTPCYMLRIVRADMHDLLTQYPQLLDTVKNLNLERRNNAKALRRLRPSASGKTASLSQLPAAVAGSATMLAGLSSTAVGVVGISSRSDLIKTATEAEAAAAAAAGAAVGTSGLPAQPPPSSAAAGPQQPVAWQAGSSSPERRQHLQQQPQQQPAELKGSPVLRRLSSQSM